MAGTFLSLRNNVSLRTLYLSLTKYKVPVKSQPYSTTVISCINNCGVVPSFSVVARLPASTSVINEKPTNAFALINCASVRNYSQTKFNILLKSHDADKRNSQSLLQSESCNYITCRRYAKGKDKGKGGKGGKGKGGGVDITKAELNQVINEARMMEDFDDAMEQLRESLVKAVAVRTNIGSLEELPIELEGDTYPLNELAQVHRKSPQLIVINCAAFPQASKSVMDAINASGMNLNPQQDGTTIAVPLPKVTREHREGLASKAKLVCNKCKDQIRQVHSTYARKAKAKEGQDISADLIFKVTQKIKELQDQRMKEIETMLADKQAELLKS